MKHFQIIVLLLLVTSSKAQVVSNLPNCPGIERDDAVAHFYNNQIFCGTGFSSGFFALKDWWVYDIDQVNWERLADIPFSPRQYVRSFQLENFIYLFGGWESDDRFFNDLWRFNCIDFSWEQMRNFPGKERWAGAGLVLNNKLYTGLGQDTTTFFTDWWEYDPLLDAWLQKAEFPGNARSKLVSSGLGGFGVIGLGQDVNTKFNDFWLYNALNNSWDKLDFLLNDSLSYVNHAVFQRKLVLVSGENLNQISPKSRILDFKDLNNVKELTVTAQEARRGGNLISDGKGTFYLLWGLDSNYKRQSSLQKWVFDDLISIKESDLEVFPNPATNELIIQYPNSVNRIEIVTLQGKKIGEYLTDSPDFMFISFDKYPSGIYILYGFKGTKRTKPYKLIKL